MMNRFFTLLLAASCLTAVGQVTYPYNPDEDGNGQIAVGDLQGILATYGNEFSPSEILVDGETLTTVLTQLQNSIDSLSGLTGGGGSVLDMPLGTVLPIATESVPEGWMLCDGREIAIEEYQGLYDLIGTTYGAGDSAFWAQVFYPATTFNIPDLRGRTIIGANDMGGVDSETLGVHPGKLGQFGGTEFHQLSQDEMPDHSHTIEGAIITGGAGTGLKTDYGCSCLGYSYGETTIAVGGDQPHNNMQPYMALNYMMKVQVAEDVVGSLNERIDQLETQLNLIPFGCTDQMSCNYDESFLVDDGTCEGLKGCMDVFSSNFNPDATCDDGSCIPYVGMFIDGGVVYDIDGNQAFIVGVMEEANTGSSYSSVSQGLQGLNSGLYTWTLPQSSQLQTICSLRTTIDNISLMNGGISFGNAFYVVAPSGGPGTCGGSPYHQMMSFPSCNGYGPGCESGDYRVRGVRVISFSN